jgi:membrane fusion protein, multidrug efflux system
MRGTYITAIVIALLISLWLFSGQIGQDDTVVHTTLAEANRQLDARAQDASPTRVRARVIHAEPQNRRVVLRGRTENKRTVDVKAETSGRITDRPVERGSRVRVGDLLCRINTEDRFAALEEARAALTQANIEHQASLRLREQGFMSETAIAQAAARLAAAEAQVERRELDIELTYVRAPFAGVVEDVLLDIGDYAAPGTTCATLVDMHPMLLVGRVSERDVGRLDLGTVVMGTLSDGRRVEGPITFIGQQSDPATRTYPVEVQVPNADFALRSGITTEIRVPVDEVMAHKISPALFALADDGSIGVRTIDEENRVEFHQVDIVLEDIDGVWVSGLPEVTTLITVGQELVVPGQRVEPTYEPAAEMPARVPSEKEGRSSSGDPGSRPDSEAPLVSLAAKP